jgi:exportin-1
MQNHMRVLEIAPENRSALLMGLEYLIGISYVDDTEVFKVVLLNYIC